MGFNRRKLYLLSLGYVVYRCYMYTCNYISDDTRFSCPLPVSLTRDVYINLSLSFIDIASYIVIHMARKYTLWLLNLV